MRSAPAGTVKVMKPEEKQRALSDFILATLASDMSSATAAAPVAEDAAVTAPVVSATLIAHSPSSPVALALAGLSADTGLHLRAIFSSLDRAVAGAQPIDTAWLAATGGLVVLRQITDVRLCDAHEQMVLGDAAAWVGDCLRRDPSKRDAYETFAKDDATTRRFAEVSFERIWALAEPVTLARALAGVAVDTALEVETPAVDVAPLAVDFTATAMIATRH